MLPGTIKYKLNVFDIIHNHELKCEEYKHLSKTERQLTYAKQLFIVKYASADEVSKYNYKEFYDVVSFDAIFKTNKYKMVFVPFTAIDNHKKCVTVAAGLLKNETTNSYVWLLKEFIKAFGEAPSIVVTDQDGAMRNAIEAEFVPCGISPKSFLQRSESENSFFSHFTNSGSTLMNFMKCFETTMEKQRHVQERLDHKTIDTVPKLRTYHSIEHTKSLVEGSEMSVIKENNFAYEETVKKKKKYQSSDKVKDREKEDDKVNLFFREDGLYKNLIPATLRNKRNMYGEKNVVVENFSYEETSIVDHCVHLLSKDEPRLGAFVEKLKLLKKNVETDCLNPPSKNKTDNLE
ncbi:FAR1-related sequence 5-like protein [Tanacetum coccineum]